MGVKDSQILVRRYDSTEQFQEDANIMAFENYKIHSWRLLFSHYVVVYQYITTRESAWRD